MSLLASLAFHASAALVASYLLSRGTPPSASWKAGEGSSEIQILLTHPLKHDAEAHDPSLRFARPAVSFPEPVAWTEAPPLAPVHVPSAPRPDASAVRPEILGGPAKLLSRAPPGEEAPSRAPPRPEPPERTDRDVLPSLEEVLPLPAPAEARPWEAPPPPLGRSGSRLAGSQGAQIVPRYPERCRRLGHEGTVVLEVHIEPSGEVAEVRVIRSAGCPELDEAALGAVRVARFEPARSGGLPVASTVLQPVVFKLR